MQSKLLILSRDLSYADGGVAQFVRTEIRDLSDALASTHFVIGSRQNEPFYKVGVRNISDLIRFARCLHSNNFDFVQLNPSLNHKSLVRDFAFCICLGLFHHRSFGAVFHGWNDELADRLSSNRFLRWLFRKSFGRASLFTVLSSEFAAQAKLLGVHSNRIHVLTTMFDDHDFLEMRQMPNKSKSILFMSRLVPEKGALELVKAFSEIQSMQREGWILTIAGDGPQRMLLQQHIDSNGLETQIKLVGYVRGQQKISMLANASIFALPTKYKEGVPISLLESMACGCSVIVSAAGGIGDILTDDEHGTVLTDLSQASLIGALKQSMLDTKFLNETAERCHQLAWNQFRSGIVIGRLEKMIADSIAGEAK